MESKVNFTLVGLFVVLLGAGIVAVLAWLSSLGDTEVFDTYRVYMTESVAGLNLNAAVRYKGVNVGKVTYIDLDRDNPERIELLLQVERDTPIRKGTMAKLVSQGITGLVTIELDGGAGTEPLVPTPENPIPVIRSGPSLVTQLEDAFKSLSKTLDALLSAENLIALTRTLYNIERVTDNLAENSTAIERNLANLEIFTSTLAANAPALDKAISSAVNAMETTAQLGEELSPLVTQFNTSAGAIEVMANSITSTSRDLNIAIDNTRKELRKEIDQLNRNTTPQLNRLLAEMSELAATLQRFTKELDRNPNVLLFGKPAGKPGPGE